MAAGTTIQHKRKAGAFVGGDLAAGEFGVDTTNGVVYFSTNGSTVTMAGGNLTIVTDATAAVTLDGSNCYPDYIRCTSGSAVTLTLAAGQSAAVGRHWIIRQAAAGVVSVSANDSTPAAITRNGAFKTDGQHTEIAVILVADGVVDIVGGVA
jgi:hypothetical protein